MISIEQAYQRLAQHVHALPTEKIKLVDAVGRILHCDVAADVDSPPHRKSVMDGFAIRSVDLNGGLRRFKIIETVVAGGWPTQSVDQGAATRIMTGAPLPVGADAVVMIEQTELETNNDENWVNIQLTSIDVGKHTMQRAANFSAGDIVLRQGHRIRATDIGLLAEVGATQIHVGGRPKLAVLATGDELVPCDQQPERGSIRNSNGPMLITLARQQGLEVTDLGIARDDVAALEKSIQLGLQQHVLLLSGGVSAGMLDLVPSTLKKFGVQEIFHKIQIKPGKPIWFGVREKDDHRCYVFGLPGNPVSSLVGFHLFVRTAIGRLAADFHPLPKSVRALLSSPHETRGDRPTYWPGKWVVDSSITRSVEPLIWHGSSDLLALGKADGFIFFPGAEQRHPSGTEVDFYPWEV